MLETRAEGTSGQEVCSALAHAASLRRSRRRRRRQVEREATFSKRQTTFGVGGGSDDVELEAERGKREQVGNLPCRVAAAENRGLPFLEDFRTDPEKRSWWICRSPIAAFRRCDGDLASEGHFSNGPRESWRRRRRRVKTCLTTLLCAMGPLCCRTKRTRRSVCGGRTRLERILSSLPPAPARPLARSLSRSGAPVARQSLVLIRAAKSADADGGEFSALGVHCASGC